MAHPSPGVIVAAVRKINSSIGSLHYQQIADKAHGGSGHQQGPADGRHAVSLTVLWGYRLA